MMDLMKALGDPEFTKALSEMPQMLMDKLNTIDDKLNRILAQVEPETVQPTADVAEQQDSNTANL